MGIFKLRRTFISEETIDDGKHTESHEEHIHLEHNEGHQDLNQDQAVVVTSLMEKYAHWVILAMLFLLPIIFIPSLSSPFQFTKTALVFAGVFIALILYLIAKLKEGQLSLPYNPILLAVWGLPVAYFLSSLFSTSPRLSFLGQNFEVDTFSFMLLMALFVLLLTVLLRTKDHILYTYLVLFVSFIVIWIFQGMRLVFGTDFLSFNVLTLPTSNILGKWNDLAIFFGLATILSLVTLASLRLSTTYKRILYVMLVVSLFFLAVVNFSIVWIIIGIFALGFFLHSVTVSRFNWKKSASVQVNEEKAQEQNTAIGNSSMLVASLITLAISAVFIFGGSTISNSVSSFFNISQIEARPSLQSTIDIGKQTYSDNLVFGSGPNTFVKQWTQFKDTTINNSIFWNADFIAGVGTIPTSFVTGGVVSVVAWIVFLVLFIYGGIRALLLTPVDSHFSYYLSLSSFLGGLYLWILTIIYTPNVVLVVLAFLFTGIFIASLRHNSSRFLEKRISFADNPKTGFVAVLVLTLILLLSVAALYTVGKQYVAAGYFQKGVIALNVEGNIDKAEENINQAAALGTSDRYYRLLADIQVARLIQLQSETSLTESELRARFQSLLVNAITYGQRSTEIDNTNYQNWFTLGRVYQSIVPLGIEGAYENALASYERALTYHPSSPSINLALARLEVDNGNTLAARDYITKALQLKNNYTEAIFLLSQLEIAEGNIKEAIASVESATLLAPNNPVIFFQLGLLRYNQGDNKEAIASFEQATRLNSVYSNARYFLGLTYDRVGRTQDAIVQFENIEELNPDNEEVKTILRNLRNGQAPFANTSPPPEPPEERSELPIDE